ncbi:fatty acyl CoA synthetase [Lysobacter sp. HX-5-24]|uniref:Fatty acyl CoA synthetase n=1 Tax=Noviluteimonas gilva TaxID=2682097 RepID=A0A7C9HXH0_9GAMM|nr:fatty acyl CoA synthetase [Lysobacter gilvus]
MLAATWATASAAPPEPAPASVDAGWILSKLARPAPTQTDFVEVRGSALLKTPLRIEGQYKRPTNDTLVRAVRAPYAETTTIRNGQATIERNGKARSFSLARAPELQGLQASFGAMLAGDRTQLERYYTIDASGTRQAWTLRLSPRDRALAAKVRDIVLRGRGAELRCIETRPVKGDLQRTLLASAARSAHGTTDAAALAALCTAQ